MCRLLTLAVTVLLSINANASLSSNIGIYSDYVFRGITQTNNGAAVQGGVDFEAPYGVTAGTWMSNVSLGGAEVDLYLDYTHSFSDDISASVGGIFYYYTKSPQLNTMEYYLGAMVYVVDFKVFWTDDYFGASTNSWYFLASGGFDLWKEYNLAVSLSLGYTMFENESRAGSEDYFDWKVSLDHTIDKFTVSVFYTDTARDDISGTIKRSADDDVIGIGLSRTFN